MLLSGGVALKDERSVVWRRCAGGGRWIRRFGGRCWWVWLMGVCLSGCGMCGIQMGIEEMGLNYGRDEGWERRWRGSVLTSWL